MRSVAPISLFSSSRCSSSLRVRVGFALIWVDVEVSGEKCDLRRHLVVRLGGDLGIAGLETGQGLLFDRALRDGPKLALQDGQQG